MELFKLFGSIALNNSGANKGIDETTGKTDRNRLTDFHGNASDFLKSRTDFDTCVFGLAGGFSY